MVKNYSKDELTNGDILCDLPSVPGKEESSTDKVAVAILEVPINTLRQHDVITICSMIHVHAHVVAIRLS